MKCSVFWDITPCSPLKVDKVSEEHIDFVVVSSVADASSFIMGVTFCSERSVDFQRVTQHYMRYDRTSCLVSFGLRTYVDNKLRYINYSIIGPIFPSQILQSL
jgi:hypothetical protein